jgi:four helix bundle protein
VSGTYADLKVWQRAMELVYRVYEVTRSFPKDELYGLVSQMRRAAVSIPSNIAEGKGRSSRKDLNVFLCHARGSLHELETQLLIAEHLGYLNQLDAARLAEHCKEIGRMLHGFIDFALPSRN